ncbi:MAG: hypothetical protein LH632_23400 [Rhodoferax sp.]|nr:hypothetical protein [Rhodoferax sp.]
MTVVEFAASLRRHVECPAQTVPPGTLREVRHAALLAAPASAHTYMTISAACADTWPCS